MFEKLRKKIRGRKEEKTAEWIVFNFGDDLEFAECNRCGWEQEHPYPGKCPKCGARMVDVYLAEYYEQAREYEGYIEL